MVQLWVNPPARHKGAAPGYQAIAAADIPTVSLPGDAGTARVIAGALRGAEGPARSFTPVNLWDVRLRPGADVTLDLPAGHTAMLVVLSGRLGLGDGAAADEAEMVLLDREGDQVRLQAETETSLLVLTGAPIEEPIVGYGPFVMNSEAEIRQAIADVQSGRFGAVPA